MFNLEYIDEYIKLALREDVGLHGDITTNSIISENAVSHGNVIYKADGVLAGINLAARVFLNLAKMMNVENIHIESMTPDGALCKKGDIVARFSGNTRLLLTGERTFLNILQRMSGIATYAKKLTDMVKGTKARIVDTRKTTPNFRIFEKAAVVMGGAFNHRFGLYDGILIKDNHITAADGIKNAVKSARNNVHHLIKIEVEVKNLAEVREALEAGCDVIMLDNMNIETMSEAVKLIAGRALVEASGGISESNLRQVAETGVDLISIGALTHQIKSQDISLKLQDAGCRHE